MSALPTYFHSSSYWLYPESDNVQFTPLLITEEMDFAVWGKVLHVIHSLKQGKSNGLRVIRH